MAKLEMLGDRVLVRPIRQEKSEGGIVLPETSHKEMTRGSVVSTGPGGMRQDGTREPMPVSEGDTVIYGLYAGSKVRVEGEDLLVLRVPDLLAVER